MARIPQHFIDELLTRTDIVQIIDQRVPLKKKGSEYSACCPFHDEKTPSFTVSPTKQFYHCFGCGAHGTAVGFLMEYDHLNFVESIESLAEQAGIEVPRENDHFEKPKQDHSLIYQALEKASLFFQQQLKTSDTAIAYMKNRGLSGEIAKNYAIGYAPGGWDHLLKTLDNDFSTDTLVKAGLINRKDSGKIYDKFRERIIFPILDTRGRTIGFGGRIIDDGQPKYLNSPETPVFHKGKTLYGMYEARKYSQRMDSLIVVEGYMDCVALAQQGFTNVVATLGTATTRDHLHTLFRSVKHVIVCFDGDNAGRKAAWKALQQAMPVIRDDLRMEFLFLPDGEDPDSYVSKTGAEKFADFLQQAQPLSQYLIQTLSGNHDLRSAEGRSQFTLEARSMLQAMSEGLLKKQLLKEMTAAAQMEPGDLDPLKQTITTAKPRRKFNRHKSTQLEMNAMRQAIAILLQSPELNSHFSETFMTRAATLPGGNLLCDLCDHIRDSGITTSARLLEIYRESGHFRTLNKLCGWLPPEETDLVALLTDSLRQLSENYRRNRFTILTEQEKNHILNEEEKEEYLLLLKERNQPQY